MTMRTVLLVAATLLLAGCTVSESDDGAPERTETAIDWEPLACDPTQATWLGGGVSLLEPWTLDADDIAAAYNATVQQTLQGHRATNKGGLIIHEWQLQRHDGKKSDLSVSQQALLGGEVEWRVHSSAGTAVQDEHEALELLHRYKETFDPDNRTDMVFQSTNESGVLEYKAWQEFAGHRILDIMGPTAAFQGVEVPDRAGYLDARPLYDLSRVGPLIDTIDAVDIALSAWFCNYPDAPITVTGHEFIVTQGTLAFAIGLEQDSEVFSCVSPILVDAVSGALIGQAGSDLCSIRDD